MAYQVELQFAAKTDTGLTRSHNEDSVSLSPAYGLAILADGMGGYNAGEVASSIATSILKETLEERLHTYKWSREGNRSKYVHQLMVESVERANAAIFEAARREPQYSGMGTTLVAALCYHDKIMIAHVGDSRVYRLRQGELSLITRDHSLLQEQIDAGLIEPELARFSPNRNLITRAVGVDNDVQVEIHEHMSRADDIYLLCSDGLSDMLSSLEISNILKSPFGDLAATCDALVARANVNGGRDNISVILIKIQSYNAETAGLLGRMLSWVK
jgi:serine/threonine protein phosphatase PrpC